MEQAEIIKEKIEGNEAQIEALLEENKKLKEHLQTKSKSNSVEKWLGYEFESSCGDTDEFLAFVKDFRKFIKENLPDNSELVGFNKNHFECSGFVKRDTHYVYFSISDVRYWQGWYDNVLIRTAKHEKDWTGGSNRFTRLPDFKKNVEYLLNFDW